MRRIRPLFSILLTTHLYKPTPAHCLIPVTADCALRHCPTQHAGFRAIPFSSSSCSVSQHSKNENLDQNAAVDDDDSDFEDGQTKSPQLDSKEDENLAGDVKALVGIIREEPSRSEVRRKLDQCGIAASSELVAQVLSQVRNDWEAAFTFFLWAGKQPGYDHSLREYHSMIAILGKMRKFDTAWALIEEMRMQKAGLSLVTPQTLLIMIRRYCAVHDVGRAINTFYAYKRFKFNAGMDDFHGLLSALCRYKNVQDAEHLLFCNRDTFPFNTKSFNIILNGWCNVIGSPREAQRIWWEMSKRGVQHDVVSYASIISCYSKSGNLNKVLKLFNKMKDMGILPDRKVYNAVIHALAKGRFVKQAINLVRTMEGNGIAPDAVTYNSLIKPLCKARKIDEARRVFDDMVQRKLFPSVQTYHAFFRVLRTGEEVFMLLEKMKNMGCEPNSDTYIMLIRKFCRWRQLDNVFKLWSEMSESGVSPDRSSYIVLIHGLFLNGKLEEAYKFYMKMKEKQYLPEPRTEEMLQAWVSGKLQMADVEDNKLNCSEPYRKTSMHPKKIDQQRHFLREPESRRVVRERGFSFWEA
ncbi:Pentatricopeptide repeat [Trema orientale]|uniref:Pentatricopeptide repeat n=1 Tax=Trema orientale TaxID=63057 RepID=A0A2P5FRF6_TREOI|nr:Pentatricopeptide repeat [Trema orientale]